MLETSPDNIWEEVGRRLLLLDLLFGNTFLLSCFSFILKYLMDTSLASAALRPPVLDGTNYSLWKVKIRYYIKSIDERAWQRIISGWTSPSMTDRDGDSLPKPETEWTTDEVQSSNYNSKTLNAIFTSVDVNMFSLITNCTSAKSAWDILQRHCECSESVRRTRLRMLTSKFEMMRMEESENILDYDRRLREIANEAFSLGDPISNERLVSKVFRSLPERFNIKICAIDEAKDTSQMPLEDLISSLRTFEMNIDMQKKDKGKKFDDYLKRIRDKKKDAKPSKSPSLPLLERPQRLPAKQQFQPRNDGKGQSNAKNDEESDEKEKSNDEDNHTSLNALLTERHCLQVNPLGIALGVATTGRNIYEKSICLKSTDSGNSSVDDELEDDEEITLESVQKLYEELFEDWTKRNKLNSSLMKENIDLKAVVAKLEVILSKKDLELGTRLSDNCYQIGEELSCKHVDCQKGKQTRVSHPVFPTSETTRCLELLHMDLIGPMEVESLGGKKYSFVCVDDFSRFSWVSFIREKSDTFDVFKNLITRITNFHALKVRRIRTDHGKEFENVSFSSFCDRKDISHEFSAPKTPQQNGIVERKNMTLQEMARVMLASKNIAKRFWAEALNTACHISNRVYLRSGSTMTSYEIIMGKKPNLKYFHVFGCVCYTLNDRDQLAKFDSKNDKCLFLGYATNSRAYRMFNLRTRTIMESINVVFDDCADLKKKTAEDDVEDLLETQTSLENTDVVPDVATSGTTRDTEDTDPQEDAHNENESADDGPCIPSKIQKNHPSSQIIRGIHEDIQTRKKESRL
ncbi:uncharacterized protein LOC142538472 [Primulina tabacum]|uniref:uncharacterized protein LOC142538472 n=1 Tax=Primulina tabacum TaxID=48773 RepID=UPI003F5A4581